MLRGSLPARDRPSSVERACAVNGLTGYSTVQRGQGSVDALNPRRTSEDSRLPVTLVNVTLLDPQSQAKCVAIEIEC